MYRVSTRTPSRANSFHTLVPIGNDHRFMLVVSIVIPGGRYSQRRLVAPSAHSANRGSYSRASGLIWVQPGSRHSPVPASVDSGSASGVSSGASNAASGGSLALLPDGVTDGGVGG